MIKLQIQSETTDRAVEIIKSAIVSEIKRFEIGLQKTEKQILSFERTYNIPSEKFLAEFA